MRRQRKRGQERRLWGEDIKGEGLGRKGGGWERGWEMKKDIRKYKEREVGRRIKARTIR